MGKRCRTDPTPRRERQVRGPSVFVSVAQRLIELRFWNGFRIGGVEPAGLIELETARPRRARCPRRPSGRQWRGSGGKIEVGEDGAYRNGIGDEGDDAHRSPTATLDGQPLETRTWPRSVRLGLPGWIGDRAALGLRQDTLGVHSVVRLEWRGRPKGLL